MKVRESGMPDEGLWETFFTPEKILQVLGFTQSVRDAADFGCGYGTFTIPAAKIISGTLYAIDIEPDMIERVREKAEKLGIHNIRYILRDFIAEGSGLGDNSVDYVMLFNILHDERPNRILKEGFRILKPGGKVGIIHWNYDNTTPGGPPMEIRPRPEQVRQWANDAGFRYKNICDLKPYHYGFVFEKPTRHES